MKWEKGKIEWYSEEFMEGMISGKDNGFYYLNNTAAKEAKGIRGKDILYRLVKSTRATRVCNIMEGKHE